jgi:predicted component of type VI protein secretion system
MKLCPKCHTENEVDANFCFRCQNKFADAQSQVRLCPAGKHTMDPDWTSCPYCKAAQSDLPAVSSAERGAAHNEAIGGVPRKKTVVEDPEAQPPVERGETVIDEETLSLAEPRRKTVFGSSESEPAARSAQAVNVKPTFRTGRRIVALLVTYSWRSEGEVFPVYEGRNYLGQDAECEICVPQDERLSRIHTAIFYRGAGFEISDEKSLNGTYVNGRPVPLTGQSLPNYAELKTGGTVWRFIAVEPETAA